MFDPPNDDKPESVREIEAEQVTHIILLATGAIVVGLFVLMAIVARVRRAPQLEAKNDINVPEASETTSTTSTQPHRRFKLRNHAERDFLIRQSLHALSFNKKQRRERRVDTLPNAPPSKAYAPPRSTTSHSNTTPTANPSSVDENSNPTTTAPNNFDFGSLLDVTGTIADIHCEGELCEGTMTVENGPPIHFIAMTPTDGRLERESAAHFVGVIIPDLDTGAAKGGPLYAGAFDLPRE